MRGIWRQAKPLLSNRTVQAAKELGIVDFHRSDKTRDLQALEIVWQITGTEPEDFPELEAALVR
jgi:hypothetical protein